MGIYAQILHKTSLIHPNPFLSSMSLDKLTDHFHIFLGIIASISNFFPSPGSMGIFLDYLFPVLSVLPFYYLIKDREDIGSKNQILIFATTYPIFNRGVISAIHYPFHQDLWATFPILLFGHFYFKKNFWGMIISALFLITFKEVFPFALIMVAAWHFLRKDYKLGLSLGAICGFWIVLVWVIRPYLLGTTLPKGEGFIRLLFFEPWSLVVQYKGRGDQVRRFFEFLLPWIPIYYYAIKQKVQPNWNLAPIIIAPFLLNFIPVMWRHHYGAPFCAFLFLILIPLKPNFHLPKKGLVVSLLIIFGLNGGLFSKGIKRLISPTTTKLCPAIPARITALDKASAYLRDNPKGKALVMAHIMPNLATRDHIYQVGLPAISEKKMGPFQYVLIEKPRKFGDRYPMHDRDFERLLATWKNNPSAQIIIDDEWVFLAKGTFHAFK